MSIVGKFISFFQILCVSRLSLGNKYIFPTQDGNSWKALNEHDIVILGELQLDDILTKVALNSTPYKENVNDPLDHYVDESTCFQESESALIEYIRKHFKDLGDESDPNTLFRRFYFDTIKNSVTKALRERNNVITEHRAYRKQKVFEKHINLIGQSIKSNIKDTFDAIDMVDVSCEILNHFSMVPSIKKALSHRIVKEEIFTALTRGTGNDVSWHEKIIKAIAPFLREGINDDYDQRIANQSTDNAIAEVCRAMIYPIGSSVTNTIQSARQYDDLLHNIKTDNKQNLQVMIEALNVNLRKSISYSLYHSPEDYQVNRLTPLLKKKFNSAFKKVVGRSHRYHAHALLYKKIRASIPVYRETNVGTILVGLRIFNDVHHEFLKRYDNMMDSEFTTYKNLQNNFTEIDSSKLSEIAQRLLKSKYNELNEKSFTVIEASLQKKYMDAHGNLFNSLHAFNEELETQAIELSKFKQGSFTYSRSYLNTLTQLFQSIVNPFMSNTTVLQEKDEL